MRIHLKIDSDGSVVPFNHQRKLTGTIHKWIGVQNREHGDVSLYSFSMLVGGKKDRSGNGLKFANGSSFFVSAHEPSLIKTIIASVQSDREMFDGLRVAEIIIQENPDLSQIDRFLVASPIFIKRKEGERIKHYAFNDNGVANYLKETLLTKMKKVGLQDETLTVEFDKTYKNAKCKVVHYNSVSNKANVCPVIINGKPETKVFAWNVGIGNSTGIGLGAIK